MQPARVPLAPRTDPESQRLDADDRRDRNWRRWGPYLADRQWGTVREDYSATGECWDYLPHDHARSRAYRWGEDGLLGITDRQGRMCFALALWNGKDPILKERLFGLGGPEGNHGEDVKELYYFLDATPTSSYLSALYKYPQAEFPYGDLVRENRRRGRAEAEYELEDTGVFKENRYFDVKIEYAKHSPDDISIRVTIDNRGPDAAPLHVLPTLWQRNTWSWGRTSEGYWPKGRIALAPALPDEAAVYADHESLGRYRMAFAPMDTSYGSAQPTPKLLFTDNETNNERLFGSANNTPWVKDAFHRHVVNGDLGAVNPAQFGTKVAAWYQGVVPAGGRVTLRMRMSAVEADASVTEPIFDDSFDDIFEKRRTEADKFYAVHRNTPMTKDEALVARQADAGLIWTRQFYNYVVDHWIDGDPGQPPAPKSRQHGRNNEWRHLYARDVMSMPDTWEYPWFALWDLAFHAVAMARVDPTFAKQQLLLFGREWYTHPNGQLPAYEFAFGDVNPPVHAWAVWRVYELSGSDETGRDRVFLERAFHHCMVNFTWWLNRKDVIGNNLFTGGFLGLDNIGVFDRSKPLPGGGVLAQADATAWMAFYATTMLAMALELAEKDEAYGDVAPKYFEHFIAIAGAMNKIGGAGLWDEQDGFYYDEIGADGYGIPLRIRSVVGLIPLIAAETIDHNMLKRSPLFARRLEWFLANKPELANHMAVLQTPEGNRRLLAIADRERLVRVLRYVLDEREMLSPYGIRSLSKVHEETPFSITIEGERFEVQYEPGESQSGMFGGNSNWRGPIWLPINYLLIEALKRHHHFYGDELRVECPVGTGNMLTLDEVAAELERRIASLFTADSEGMRACHDGYPAYHEDPNFRELVLFHEYFHGDTGRGLGASHQTGWTALAANLVERVAVHRAQVEKAAAVKK